MTATRNLVPALAVRFASRGRSPNATSIYGVSSQAKSRVPGRERRGGSTARKGGTGFAAEDAAERAHRHAERQVILTGPNNEPNGPDLIVDGGKVQVKYFPNPASTMNAAFDKCGRYRYCGQQLEVPRDQYETCIELMRGKIKKGQVDGVVDPGKAEAMVRCGPVTYKQARNIAKAGTVDSFCFDVETQAVLIPRTFVLSAGLDCVRSLWRRQRALAAMSKAVCNGVVSSVNSWFTGVCTSQVLANAYCSRGCRWRSERSQDGRCRRLAVGTRRHRSHRDLSTATVVRCCPERLQSAAVPPRSLLGAR
jgi:hypothetical protein